VTRFREEYYVPEAKKRARARCAARAGRDIKADTARSKAIAWQQSNKTLRARKKEQATQGRLMDA